MLEREEDGFTSKYMHLTLFSGTMFLWASLSPLRPQLLRRNNSG